jgi:very-short-patch-repair endonuclease
MSRPGQREFARQMRRQPTHCEARLWERLRGRQFEGLKFRRQAPIGRYIVDFFCAEQGLILEADGPTHEDSERDQVRDAWLAERGYRLLRFRNEQIAMNLDQVLDIIRSHIIGPTT